MQIILDWFNSLPEKIQEEIAGLAGHFHLDETIDKVRRDRKLKNDKFKEFLSSEGLSEMEVVRRTLYITRLLSFVFSNRSTQQDWTEHLDLVLDMRTIATEKGSSTSVEDGLLDTFEERKKFWLTLTDEWEKMNQNQISNKQIADWYFSTSIKSYE